MNNDVKDLDDGIEKNKKIEKINFGKSNIEMRETYIDDNGYERDNIKNLEISNVPFTTIHNNEYEQLKRFKEENLKIQRRDFALIINSGAILPIDHVDYIKDRVKIEIYDINDYNVEIDGKKYVIKSQILIDKIKSFIDNNLDSLIEWSKNETNKFLISHDYYRHSNIRTNIKVKCGQLIVNVKGQISGELGKNIDDFINNIKELMISESNLTVSELDTNFDQTYDNFYPSEIE